MKCLVVLSLLALATAKPSGLLAPYAASYAAPYAAYASYAAAPLAVAHAAAPVAVAHAAPVAVAHAAPVAVAHAAPVAVAHAAPVAVHHAVAPVAVGVAASTSSQHHAQDTLGQYSYGYADRNSQKQEVRTADGVTRGGYSYVDGHGLVQSASYVSDPVHGFRVAATNLPFGPAAPAGHALFRRRRSLGLVAPYASHVAVAHAAPVYVHPVSSFGYSTASVHADPVVVPAVAHAAHWAHAAPVHAW
ncbi:hypothetical protein C0J52_27762 [Blattella germanica]|nr:hypothetical protein C0J52_27762 [Blattella germanica]